MSLRLVVLDTNILVSAGVRAGGLEAQVLDLVLEDELILLTCPGVISEYLDVLHRPTFRRFGIPPVWLDLVLLLSQHRTENPPPWPVPDPDPDDLVFLALAHAMDATLVTGNLKDYPVEIRQGTNLFSARAFLERYRSRG